MKLIVPKYPHRSWQHSLGFVATLVCPRGKIQRISKLQRRAVLSVGYQVRVARFFAPNPDCARLLMGRRVWPNLDARTKKVLLGDLHVFAAAAADRFSIDTAFENFVRQIPAQRLRDLVSWELPSVGFDERTGDAYVYTGQLVAALAKYRFPANRVRAKVYAHRPRRQHSLYDSANLVEHVFGAFVDTNRDLLCRLCATSREASLLTGCHVNTADAIRQRRGTLTL